MGLRRPACYAPSATRIGTATAAASCIVANASMVAAGSAMGSKNATTKAQAPHDSPLVSVLLWQRRGALVCLRPALHNDSAADVSRAYALGRRLRA